MITDLLTVADWLIKIMKKDIEPNQLIHTVLFFLIYFYFFAKERFATMVRRHDD